METTVVDDDSLASENVISIIPEACSSRRRRLADLISMDLARGAPDVGTPPELISHVASLVLSANHQYPAIEGTEELRLAVARRYGERTNAGLTADSVAITAGATEALAACLVASIEVGDEVILFEPGFVSFAPFIERLGGIAVPVEVTFPSGEIDFEELNRAISPRTKALVFVNPANPSGICYDRQTVVRITRLCSVRNITLIADEVWEDVIFDGGSHVSVLDNPSTGRVLKIGAVGKSFAVTGWKIAWVIGASDLILRVVEAHGMLTFAVNPVMQSASAWALDNRERLIRAMLPALSNARSKFAEALLLGGMRPVVGPATYFLMLDLDLENVKIGATAFCAELANLEKVRALPLSIFRHSKGSDKFVRLCFTKSDGDLREAAIRLGRLARRFRSDVR